MQKTKGNLSVVLDGRGPLTLRPNDYQATGGEGSVYKASGTAIKIFHEQKRVLWNNVDGKVAFFRANPHPYVVFPLGRVMTSSGETIGYYMKFVNGEPIARVFTNDFRKRTGFSNDKASLLIDRMRDIVMYAHERDALLIDANELGYFVVNNNSQEPEPRIIDVDCWVIDDKWPPSCPIMPSIRDWHVRQGKQWNEGTDWFAWGVVTFQVYTGIHPYKGTLIGYKRNELERRMRDNASVFTNNVRLNKAVRDFSCIPGHLLDWYVATFQSGERTIPPSPFETGVATTQVARVLHAITTATGILVFDKLLGKIGVQVIRFFPCGVALLESGKLIDVSKSRQIGIAQSRDCEIVKVQNGWLKTDLEDGNIRFFHINEVSLDEKEMTLNLNGHQLLRYGNRLFVVTDRGLTEMTLKVLGKPILSVGQTWGVMINSTRWFDGVGIQDTMGATYVIAPFSDNSCAQIRVRELDGLKPIMAKAGNRFITVIALDGNGVYQKIELTMDRGYSSYKVWQEATDSPDLNIAILPKGVCATIVNDGELDIFVPTSGTFNKIQDKYVLTDMALANWENKVVYIQNGELWSVRMSGK